MILPCIDLMDGKVVQLVQGRDKVLEGGTLDEMLERFAGFSEIQVIDLDAALGRGNNDALVEYLARRSAIRAGGGVRTPDRARRLAQRGARKIIIGTAAFTTTGVDHGRLARMRDAAGRDRLLVALDSLEGRVVVKGWRESTAFSAEEVIAALEPYCSGFLCTCVDREGMLAGTDLAWFRRLRAATDLELTAAGGITTLDEVRALLAMRIHVALGMALYRRRLHPAALLELERSFPPE